MVSLFLLLPPSGCGAFRSQQYRHFTTPTPLPAADTLVIGFLGGRDRWDDERRAVRQLALKLRQRRLPGVHVETVENLRRPLALELIRRALDRNRDAQLEAEERAAARLILYGQSFGGAAVVKLARALEREAIPVLLTVQIDSVGRGDAVIPANVRRAANLFQSDGLFIRGEREIRAADSARTTIVGNFKSTYRDNQIDLARVPWHKKLGRLAHTRMEHDPAVWPQVEELILAELSPPR